MRRKWAQWYCHFVGLLPVTGSDQKDRLREGGSDDDSWNCHHTGKIFMEGENKCANLQTLKFDTA